MAAIATVAAAMLAGACSDGPDVFADRSGPVAAQQVAALMADAAPAGFAVLGSVEQVSVTGADPGQDLALHDDAGRSVATGRTDANGALIFREVEPGEGYRVATIDGEPEASPPFEVMSIEGSTPDQAFYESQELDDGYTYITTRDGTQLAASVYLPGPAEDGPYPTVVEYSGYSPAKPAVNLIEQRWEDLSDKLPEGMTVEAVCELAPFACHAPDQPSSIIAHALGYAVVAVNMRGTGCSGGAYDFFEPLQVLDGYDVVETVAAQDWVKGHRVGMVGLSYPGIAQLFVAAAQPPSLAAITPLSVYDDTARGVLAPGGIFNDGFALQWADEVLASAEPYGQGWEQELVDAGDEICEANQGLRGQNVDPVEKAKRYPYYDPEVADPLSPAKFVDRIEAAVFLGGAFQDEQTGGRFPLLFDDFDNARVTRFAVWNGTHGDGFAPFNLVEWKTFLDFYVAEELTPRTPAFDVFAPILIEEVFGAPAQLPPQRMFEEYDSFEEQRAAYEAEPHVRILLENGAADPEHPGAPGYTTEILSDTWPPRAVTARHWYLTADGTLEASAPTVEDGRASRFLYDHDLARLTTVKGGGAEDLFSADVVYDWQQEPDGSAAVFVTDEFDEDVVMIGHGSVDLWVRTSTDEADLGVTLSEVRPDGSETYVQSGLQRTTHRALSPESTELIPVHEGLEKDASPMPVGEFEQVRVALFPFAHVFRAGSRLRISIHTPGGDKTRWTYLVADQPEGTTIDIGHDAAHPSRIVLPVVPGITGYPPERPPCGSLRAQPCRPYVEYRNTLVDG